MMITDINSEDRLVQQTFADYLRDRLGWESVYAHNAETFAPEGVLGRVSDREVVLARDLRAALARLNPDIPETAREQAIEKLIRIDFARSLIQHNREFYGFIRGGVPVEWRDAAGETRHAHARVIDFSNGSGPDGKPNNRFLAVREVGAGVREPFRYYASRDGAHTYTYDTLNRLVEAVIPLPSKPQEGYVDWTRAATRARNAIAQIPGNMQKNAYGLFGEAH